MRVEPCITRNSSITSSLYELLFYFNPIPRRIKITIVDNGWFIIIYYWASFQNVKDRTFFFPIFYGKYFWCRAYFFNISCILGMLSKCSCLQTKIIFCSWGNIFCTIHCKIGISKTLINPYIQMQQILIHNQSEE